MDEKTSLKEQKDKRLKVAREFRLKNLKSIADKNKALHKIAKKNTLQAIIFSCTSILFGTIFIFLLRKSGGLTKIVENAVVGVGSLMKIFSDLRSFATSSTDDDCIAIKFSEVDDESVDLSLKITDEDDIRNTENTIEYWNSWLIMLKSFYTTFTLFSSLLLIVFIILDFTSDEKNVVPINLAIIIFGVISLIFSGLIRYSLKIFTFTGDGGKDIERLLNGINVHIKRNTALDLKKLLKDHVKPHILEDVNKSEQNSELKFFEKFITRKSQETSHEENLIKKLIASAPKRSNSEKKKRKEFNHLKKSLGSITSQIESKQADWNVVADWIWNLFTAMKGFECILQKNTNPQLELSMKKLMKKLSLKELVVIILGSDISESISESIKLSVDYHILRELHGASKELLNIIKKSEQPSKNESDEIEEEFSKISKKLEAINQIIEKSQTLLTKEFTDNLCEDLGGIKEKLKYINWKAEHLNNYTDPTSLQVDRLREEIPKILNSKNLEEYVSKQADTKQILKVYKFLGEYGKWKKNQTSKQENTKQTSKLEEITNLPMIIYEIEKELSKTPKILKEIDQKIETPIEDLNFAKKVYDNSKNKLDDIENQLFKMLKKIRQDNDVDKELTDNFADSTPDCNISKIENLYDKLKKETSQKISEEESKELKELLERLLEELFSDYIEEISKYDELKTETDKLKELKKEISQKTLREESDLTHEISEIKNKYDKLKKEIESKKETVELNKETKLKKETNELKKETDEREESDFTRKISIIVKLYDSYKKETSQETSREELKELLKKFNQEAKDSILKSFKNLLSNDHQHKKLQIGLDELRDFMEFEKLYKLFKDINNETFKSINVTAYLLNDKDVFEPLYCQILNLIKVAEDDTKFNPISCYIDFGKHFGTYLFQSLIPDKKIRGPHKEPNQKLIRCYYRLGELLFSDNDGENAPKKVTDHQHRKARNIYELYNEMLLIYNSKKDNNNNNNDEKPKKPIDMIKEIKIRYAATIFALSNDDVKYLIEESKSKSNKGKEKSKSDPVANNEGEHDKSGNQGSVVMEIQNEEKQL